MTNSGSVLRSKAAFLTLAASLLFGQGAFCQTAPADKKCNPEQLKTSTKGLAGGASHFGYALEVTNVSTATCLLEGVPDIRVPGDSATKIPTCANCADYLFQQRSPEPVILRTGASAYSLLGLFNAAGEPCRKIDLVQIVLPGSSHALEFHRLASIGDGARIGQGFAQFCGTVNVSAWRAGRYDKSLCLNCGKN